MISFTRKQDWLSTRVSEYDDAALTEMFRAALDHLDNGYLSEGLLLSLEREYRRQTNGGVVNSLRDVENAVTIELAIRYCENR